MNGPTSRGTARRFDWALFLGDTAIASWLWFSFWSFNERTAGLWARVLFPALAVATLAWILGLHRFIPGARSALLAKTAVLGVAIAALAYAAARIRILGLSGREALWLGAAASIFLWIMRSIYWRTGESHADRAREILRWIAVGLAATLVLLPLYFAGSIGAGDAYWYVLMLSDFLTQLKAGVFPVWVGQSTFAFNGAVSPLRYAPGFQYYGGLMDFLTAMSLRPGVVKNICLAFTGICGGFSAYACLRQISPRRPWIACFLSILWILGPGVLAPLTSGDQYMTFIAFPFVPLVLLGCWRVWEFDDRWGRFWIAVGLAGLWFCHSPIALWLTLISGALYAGAALTRRSWRSELRSVSMMAAIFLTLGSLPFLSFFSLDNQIHSQSVGLAAAEQVHFYFPNNFKPVAPLLGGLADYQIGYSLLATLVVALLAMFVSRPKGAWAFALVSVAIIPCTVPVPWATDAFWGHVPGWFVSVNNVWPMQRLFLVWSSLIIFTAAIILGSPRASGQASRHGAIIGFLACGLIWSAHEGWTLSTRLSRSRSTPAQSRLIESPDNTELGRYPYSSFEFTPAYASHGYMDAWFENRLLDRPSLRTLVTNADAAAPGDASPAAGPAVGELLQHGVVTAENIANSDFYVLKPPLLLEPRKHYALRLEFAQPDIVGTLQIANDGIFREYLLPDSGSGMERRGPPRSFGTTPTSGRVIPLAVDEKGAGSPNTLLITVRKTRDNFTAGRFWLYSYDRSRLPIRVDSWIPYRAHLNAPKAAYLESPRMWLRGWRATVNGRPTATERSPENLVMIPVPPGESAIALDFVPPLAVSVSFWIGLGGWLLLCTAAFAWLFRGRRLERVPA